MQVKKAVDSEQAASTAYKDTKRDKSMQKQAPTPAPASNVRKPP